MKTDSIMTNENEIYKDNFILVYDREYKKQNGNENHSKFIVLEISGKNELKKGTPKIKESFINFERTKEYEYYKDGKLISTNAYKYDNNGNVIEHAYIQKNNPETNRKTRYFYNQQNKCVRIEFYDAENLVTETCLYEYDCKENCMMIICRNSTGKLRYKFTFDYSQENNKIKECCFKGNGHLAWEAHYIYDSKGLLIEKAYIKREVLFYRIIYTYDFEGNKLSTKKYIHKDHIEQWDGKMNAGHLDFMLWTEIG